MAPKRKRPEKPQRVVSSDADPEVEGGASSGSDFEQTRQKKKQKPAPRKEGAPKKKAAPKKTSSASAATSDNAPTRTKPSGKTAKAPSRRARTRGANLTKEGIAVQRRETDGEMRLSVHLSNLEKMQRAIKAYNITSRSVDLGEMISGTTTRPLAPQTADANKSLPSLTATLLAELFTPPAADQGWRVKRKTSEANAQESEQSTPADLKGAIRVWEFKGQKRLELHREGSNHDHINFWFHNTYQFDVKDVTTLEAIATVLENFMNNWPLPVTASNKFADLVSKAAMAYVSNELCISAPYWRPSVGWRLNIRFLDEISGQHDKVTFDTAKGMRPQHQIPALPTSASLSHPPNPKHESTEVRVPETTHDDGTKTFDSLLSDAWESDAAIIRQGDKPDVSGLKSTEAFLRFVAFKCANLVTTKSKIKEQYNSFMALFSPPTSTTRSKEGRTKKDTDTPAPAKSSKGRVKKSTDAPGKNKFSSASGGLFSAYSDKREATIEIRIAPRLLGQMGFDVPTKTQANKLVRCQVRHPSAAWVIPVFEAADRTYQDTHDPVETCLAMAEMCDLVNAQVRAGFPPPSHCSCTMNMQREVSHRCGRCLSRVLCITRQQSMLGDFVCLACFEKDDASKQYSTAARAEKSITTSHQKEVAQLQESLDDEHNKQILSDLIDDVRVKFEGYEFTTYPDEYAGISRSYPIAIHPEMLTLDATNPYHFSDSGRARKHIRGNVHLCTSSANISKGQHLVGNLEEIGLFTREKQGKSSQERLELAQELMLRCDELHAVDMKQKRTTKTMLAAAATTADEFQTIREEWLSGKLATGDVEAAEKARSHAKRYVAYTCSGGGGFSEADQEDIRTIVEDMEIKYRIEIETAEDGAPWFSEIVPIPDGWGWGRLYSFCKVRLNRLKVDCNRYWITVDTPTSLLCEKLYQCRCEGMTEEFLGLPVTVYLGHPLNMSIAHKVHARQMRTGFPPRPKRLSDRDDTRNNILIETVFSNFLKWYYHPRYYELLQKIIAEINIPKSLYNRDAPAPTGVTTTPDPDDTDLPDGVGDSLFLPALSDESLQVYNEETAPTEGDEENFVGEEEGEEEGPLLL